MRDITDIALSYKKRAKNKLSFVKTKQFIASLAIALGVAGIGFAALASADNLVTWSGQGVTNGTLNTTQCDENNTGYLLWVFTGGPGVTSATITITNSATNVEGHVTMTQEGNGAFHYTSAFYPLNTVGASVTYVGTASNPQLVISHGCPGGTSTTTTALHDSNGAAVAVGASVPLGTTMQDSATVTLTPSAIPTGSVTFTFFTNGTCAGNGSPAGITPLNGANPGVADPSSSEGPLTPGNYSFEASWPGQAGYTGSTSSCENFTVTQAQLGINTTVHNDSGDVALIGNLPLGGGAHDSATVTGGVASFTLPNVTFYFFAKGVACTNGSITGGTLLNTLAPNNTTGIAHPSTSETLLAAGTYNFMAVVAGDSNYLGAISNCEPFTVNKAQLGVSTVAHNAAHLDITNGSVGLGSVTHDTATVTGAVSGFPVPTSVSFTLTTGYTNSCISGAAVGNDGAELSGAYKSAGSVPLGAGSYAYRASIGGNDNYIGADSTCEPFNVNKAQLGITTDIHNANHQIVTTVSQGAVVHDTATITGAVNGFSTAAVTFTFFTNNTCTGTGTSVANTGTDQGNASAVRSADSAALAPGFYSYSATVPGNANYLGATATCEPLTVSAFWCSPGFWATAIQFSRFDVNTYLLTHGIAANIATAHFTGITDPYSSIPSFLHAAGLKKGSPPSPSLKTVLANPSVYGGPAFNSVADYFAYLLGWGGTQLTGENCPLDAHGNLITTTTIQTL